MSVNLDKALRLTGAIPIDNIDDAEEVLENFCSKDIAVCVTNRNTNIQQGTHYHDSYEFVLCYSNIPSIIIDNKMYNRKKHSLFAINPMQEHGISVDYKGFHLCGIHIDKKLVSEVAKEIYNNSDITFTNDSYIASHDISMLIRLFLEELRYKQTGYEFIADNLSRIIVANLIRNIKHNLPPKLHNGTNYLNENVKKAIDYMNENYANGISCEEISNLIGIGKFSFIRSFKSQVGKTPYEYLLDLKIEKSKKMLRSKEFSITEISLLCGFSSHSHFTSTFKKITGLSPTEYKISL